GSQNLRADILCETQRKTVELALALAEDSPLPVRYLNVGGGFGIPYGEKDQPLDIAPIGANLAGLLDELVRRRLPDARPNLEPGRHLAGRPRAHRCAASNMGPGDAGESPGPAGDAVGGGGGARPPDRQRGRRAVHAARPAGRF